MFYPKALGVLVQRIGLAIASTTASKIIYMSMLDKIIRAPISFFDTTPTGRILNRFGHDMQVLDTGMRGTIASVLRGFAGILTTLIGISYTSPMFLAVFVALAVLYFFIQVW